jgi:hypothetical protein
MDPILYGLILFNPKGFYMTYPKRLPRTNDKVGKDMGHVSVD